MYFQANGTNVYANTGGKAFDQRKPVVIFLCGSGFYHTFWELHSRFFACRNYSVLVPDYPGHYHSDGPLLTRIEAMSDWLINVVEALDANRISLVAHSQGCLVALEHAARYPQRLRSVSFVASGLATPVNPALIDNAKQHRETAIAMMLSWGFAAADHSNGDPAPRSSMIAGARKMMLGNNPDALLADLLACNAYQNGATAAASIQLPVQVILGGQDRMAPRQAGLALARGLPNAAGGVQLNIIERCGHMLPLEAPDECCELLKAFILSNNPPAQQ